MFQIPHATAPEIKYLQQSKTTFFTMSENDQESSSETVKKENVKPIQSASFEFITDVKIEHDSSSSDFENDLPLSEIKKSGGSDNPKKPKTKFPTDDKYKGKIMIYNLNREELEEERERESKKESYLKLPFKCDSCVKGFDHENTLKNHEDKQHSQVDKEFCKLKGTFK